MCASSWVNPPHAQQPVHHARALVAVNRAELAQPDRQIAVAAQLVLVDQDVERAVHRPELVFDVVELHRLEHVVRVEIRVAGGLPQVVFGDVRREDETVAALEVLLPQPVLDDLAHQRALGVPEDQPRPGAVLHREQVELPAQLAVVALLGLLELVQILLEILGREERGAVDPLQALVSLIPLPVRAGDREQFEGLDAAHRGDVRPAAEVVELLAGLVDRHLRIVGLLRD